MKKTVTLLGLVSSVGVLLLAGCATDGGLITMDSPTGQQKMAMPKSLWTGAASGAQADALAQEVSMANNNTMKEFDRLDGRLDAMQQSEKRNLEIAQECLKKLEQISSDQGTGQITLFFKTGSDDLDHFQFERLVGFLDYLSRSSRGRAIILVSIGSASAAGNPHYNKKLSTARSEAPLPVIDQYLVDVPHKYYKVVGLGDLYAPRNASKQIEYRYQSVRIIAAYDERNLQAIGEI